MKNLISFLCEHQVKFVNLPGKHRVKLWTDSLSLQAQILLPTIIVNNNLSTEEDGECLILGGSFFSK